MHNIHVYQDPRKLKCDGRHFTIPRGNIFEKRHLQSLLGPEEGHMFAETTQYDSSRFTPEGKTKKVSKLLAVYLLALTILIALNNSGFWIAAFVQKFPRPFPPVKIYAHYRWLQP